MRAVSDPDVMTTAEAAAFLGRSVAQVNRYAATGRLKVHGENVGRIFLRADVEDLAVLLAHDHDGSAA